MSWNKNWSDEKKQKVLAQHREYMKSYVLSESQKQKKRISNRIRLRKNPEKHRLAEQSTRRRDPLRYMLIQARSRAKRLGREFNLPLDYFKECPLYCPVSGTRLTYINNKRIKPDSASLDRVDNTKGYVIGNVRIVSLSVNASKSNTYCKIND